MTTKSNPADEMFWHIVSFESTAYTIGAVSCTRDRKHGRQISNRGVCCQWLGALATGFLVRWSASYVSKNNGDSRWLKGIAVALAVISGMSCPCSNIVGFQLRACPHAVFSSACELAVRQSGLSATGNVCFTDPYLVTGRPGNGENGTTRDTRAEPPFTASDRWSQLRFGCQRHLVSGMGPCALC